MTKEEVYDASINPLIAEILRLCKEHKIPMVSSFALDDDGLMCTSVLLEEEWGPTASLREAASALLSQRRSMMRISVSDSDGNRREEVVIA